MTDNRRNLRRPIVSLLKLSAMRCLRSTDPRFEAVMRFRRRAMDERYLSLLKKTLDTYFSGDAERYDYYSCFSIWSMDRRYLTYELCYYAVNISAHNFRIVPRDLVDDDMIELVRYMTDDVMLYFPYLRDALKTKDMTRAAVSRLPYESVSAVVMATPIEFRDSDFFDAIAERCATLDTSFLRRLFAK